MSILSVGALAPQSQSKPPPEEEASRSPSGGSATRESEAPSDKALAQPSQAPPVEQPTASPPAPNAAPVVPSAPPDPAGSVVRSLAEASTTEATNPVSDAALTTAEARSLAEATRAEASVQAMLSDLAEPPKAPTVDVGVVDGRQAQDAGPYSDAQPAVATEPPLPPNIEARV